MFQGVLFTSVPFFDFLITIGHGMTCYRLFIYFYFVSLLHLLIFMPLCFSLSYQFNLVSLRAQGGYFGGGGSFLVGLALVIWGVLNFLKYSK